MAAVTGAISGTSTPFRDCDSRNGSDSTPKRRTPSLNGSATFRRVSSPRSGASPHSVLSVEDKMAALQNLFSDKLLITELRGQHGATRKLENDYNLTEEDDDTFTVSDYPTDGRYSKETDYETDLDMDYDEWIHEEEIQLEKDQTGERKYIHMCNETGVIPVSYFLKHIEDKEFRMRFHGLGPLGAKAIAYPMKTNKKIEVLNLEGNWILGEGSEYLARMLVGNFCITELYLAENRIGNTGAEAMADLLSKNDSIVTIDLSGNEIDDSGAEKLCTTLLKNSSVKHLFLANNRLEERAGIALRELLSHNEVIETLDLSWNHFRTKGAVALGEGLMENYGLRCMKLSMNGFGLDGSEAVGKALKINRTLKDLNISHNRIPERGAIVIATGLQTNDCLETLRIGSNPLGHSGPVAIITEVSKNDMSSVQTLDFSNVLVTPEFTEVQENLEAARAMTITHGGIVGEKYEMDYLTHDPLAEFRRNPVNRLFEYARDTGYRLIDLFKDFDKDKNNSISRDEFILGLKRAGMKISVRQMEILLDKLDTNKDGCVDYGELIDADTKYRQKQRELIRSQNTKSRESRPEFRLERTESILTKEMLEGL
ncbi:leucine-rich repeat-containing protein 74B-like [Ylistrum balloti]|uniref:leucine-rich repeat-containing protein 74B-like n=1 Tax=Ylistrum balloti TaxID=509963 RepID=UPI0029057F67|nr:leucine-rich repeat-containing protein 74B-like [Ylistrum balloti]